MLREPAASQIHGGWMQRWRFNEPTGCQAGVIIPDMPHVLLAVQERYLTHLLASKD